MELKKLIGQVLYEDLAAQVATRDAGGNPLVPPYTHLVQFCEPVVAWHAFISMLRSGIVQVGDAGIKETRTDNTEPVRQWIYNTALENAWQKADMFSETLLSWLELNANRFPLFAQSEGRKSHKAMFVQNISQLETWHGIGTSFRLFNVLRQQFLTTELQYVQPTMLPPLFELLKNKLASGANLSQEEAQAIFYARAIVTFFSLRDALPVLNINISIGGITVRRTDDGIIRHEKPDESNIRWLSEHLTARGNYWVQTLRDYLVANQQRLPAFRDSYQQNACLPANEASKGIFYL